MKHYFLLTVTILTMNSCSRNNAKIENKSSENIFEQISGNYNKEIDAWETNDPKYATHIGSDNIPIGSFEFEGEPYASISEMDKDENSLGSGLINKKGQIIVKPKYSGITLGFIHGLCEVTDKNNKYGFVSEKGIEIVKPQYDCSGLNSKDEMTIDSTIIRVCKNEKEGFINLKGEIVIPIQYKSLQLVGEKLIMFMDEPAKWGFINYKNKIILKPEFSHTNIFRDGKMTLQKNDGEEYIVYANGKVEKE